ncbi:MAG TPA: aldo/keto reductase, partial [Nakamurella sp.]|nr:aldo/keto reductase [Nakamurella sp.]
MADQTFRRLGTSGLSVSTAGLGCNNLGRVGSATAEPAGARAVVDAALDAGITLFDTADVYGIPPGRSEELLGAALGSRRGDVVIATKFGMDARGANGPDFGARGSRRYIRQAVEASLRRLGTDWIDLYQLHRPDPDTPLEETLAALD